jgi:polysaccharide pyruvyl transferase WcaK-like protein
LTATTQVTSPGPERPQRLLLIGNFGNGNVGDDAILLQAATCAAAQGEVTVLSRRPESTAKLVPDARSVTMVSRDAMIAFFRTDVVVLGGGGIFGKGLPPLVSLLPFVLLAAEAIGKQVEIRSIGAYSDMPAPVAWALRRVVRRARYVSARDAASVEVLGGGKVVLVKDPAWNLAPAEPALVDAALEQAGVAAGQLLVAVSMKPTSDAAMDDRCLTTMAQALDKWAENSDGQIVFMSFSDKGDYDLGAQVTDLLLGERLQSQMRCGNRVRFVGPGLHPAVMLGVVQRCSAMVAMRLHAQIFAAAVDRPVFGVSFEPKSDEFLTSIGIAPLRPDDVTAEDLCSWLDGVASVA